jgi:hypothetical protein
VVLSVLLTVCRVSCVLLLLLQDDTDQDAEAPVQRQAAKGQDRQALRGGWDRGVGGVWVLVQLHGLLSICAPRLLLGSVQEWQ